MTNLVLKNAIEFVGIAAVTFAILTIKELRSKKKKN